MKPRRVVLPGEGVDGLMLGMTRAELWTKTDSHVLAYLGHHSEPGERSDDFVALGVHAHYRASRCAQLWVFPHLPNQGLCPVLLDGEDISEFTREDLTAFLELRAWARVDGYEEIAVKSRGLTFWFREDYEEPPRLEFVAIYPPSD